MPKLKVPHDKLREKYAELKSAYKVADFYGISTTTVYHALKYPHGKPPKTNTPYETIISEIENCGSCVGAARSLGISVRTVYRALKFFNDGIIKLPEKQKEKTEVQIPLQQKRREITLTLTKKITDIHIQDEDGTYLGTITLN